MNMSTAYLQEFATELVCFLKEFRNIEFLLGCLGGGSVLTRESTREPGRTLELQVLERESERIEVAGFSDGPSASIGVNALITSSGVELTGTPMLIVNGVPAEEIGMNEKDKS